MAATMKYEVECIAHVCKVVTVSAVDEQDACEQAEALLEDELNKALPSGCTLSLTEAIGFNG